MKIPGQIFTDAVLVVEAQDAQCTFKLAGRHAFCVIVWLQARAPLPQHTHSFLQPRFLRKISRVGVWSKWAHTHIVSQIKLSCISNVYEYCCCLFPGGGFFVGRLPFQACKLGGRFGLTTSVYWVVLACIGLYWVALASPPPALGLQHNAVVRPHCKLQSEKDTDMVAAAALIIRCIS